MFEDNLIDACERARGWGGDASSPALRLPPSPPTPLLHQPPLYVPPSTHTPLHTLPPPLPFLSTPPPPSPPTPLPPRPPPHHFAPRHPPALHYSATTPHHPRCHPSPRFARVLCVKVIVQVTLSDSVTRDVEHTRIDVVGHSRLQR